MTSQIFMLILIVGGIYLLSDEFYGNQNITKLTLALWGKQATPSDGTIMFNGIPILPPDINGENGMV